ncbi:hypothetical protein OIV83_004497 [Microbotryomycetes sp. JL201]|nr:hypothetical protein OIV83_004497 [Microbotryomycetes sp. JL201]
MTDRLRLPASGLESLVLYWVLPLLAPGQGGVMLDSAETALTMERTYHTLLSNVNDTVVMTWNDSMLIILEYGTRTEVQLSRTMTDRIALNSNSVRQGGNLVFEPWRFRTWVMRADPHHSFARPLQPLNGGDSNGGSIRQGLATFLPRLETIHVRGDLASPSISSTEVGVRDFIGNLVLAKEQVPSFLPRLQTLEFAVNPGVPPHVRHWVFTDPTQRILTVLDQPAFSRIECVRVSWLNIIDNFDELADKLKRERGRCNDS